MEKIQDKSYGVILVTSAKPRKFLILHQVTGNWSFPKGHAEDGEDEHGAALRELEEETKITKINFLPLVPIIEEYDFTKDGILYHKTNTLFFAETEQVEIEFQVKEITEYKWATYQEAIETFLYEDQIKRMPSINEIVENYDKMGV